MTNQEITKGYIDAHCPMTRTEFERAYAECLAEAIKADPDEYGCGPDYAPTIARKMICALDRGSANITGSDGFKRLAKRLGIKHTVRDITAAWRACRDEEEA